MFDLTREVAVMAIVNRTPDSFFDKGATFQKSAATAAVSRAVDDGADWIDIGGVPFGPGTDVGVQEEIDRVVPIVAAARAAGDVVISVDTTRSDVAAVCLAHGADVINDTSGLRDPEMAPVVAAANAGIVVTHSAAPPRRALRRPQYDDVVTAVREFLIERVALALDAGVQPGRIVIDPGHDLHKNTYHSLELTRRLGEIASLGLPVLVAVSNKDFIGETLDAPLDVRLAGTLAAVTYCVLAGARIVRVHDVRAVVDAVRMTEAILGFRSPAAPRHNFT